MNTDAYYSRLAEEYYGGDEPKYEINSVALEDTIYEAIFEATGDEEPDEAEVQAIIEGIIESHDRESKTAVFKWAGGTIGIDLHLEAIEEEPYDSSDDYDIRNER